MKRSPSRKPAAGPLAGSLLAFLLAAPAVGAAAAADWPITGPTAWLDDLGPISPQDWTYERAAHLLERAGFGGTPEEIRRLAAMSPQKAVGFLVDYESVDDSGLPPFVESGIFDPAMDPFPKSRADAVRQARQRGESMGVAVQEQGPRRLQPVVNKFFYGLRANLFESRRAAQWWANRMLASPRPLEEKMALFWHGHFATSDAKVRDYRKMRLQLDLFHTHATGNFRDLLLGVTQDPAMLSFLDNASNVKDHPNENFGRELLELFSMGIGHYSEEDVREVARAFTGWTDRNLVFYIDETQHDGGTKKVLGRTGAFGGEEVIDIILAQPATAAFISAKIYRFLSREELSPHVASKLAALLRQHDYELKPLLKRILLSKDFYSSASYATQIKSPLHLVVSTYKKLGLGEIPGIPDFHHTTSRLGQTLFHPPNVAGWAAGRTWITPALLLERGNFARQVLFPDVDGFVAPDRVMPGIYARVGEKLARGMTITQATTSGDSSFSQLANVEEEYNTRYGVYMGYQEAFKVVKPVPRAPAPMDWPALLGPGLGGEPAPEAVVDALIRRFLRVPLKPDHRQTLVDYLKRRLPGGAGDKVDLAAPQVDYALRLVLHLVLSTSEYQLG